MILTIGKDSYKWFQEKCTGEFWNGYQMNTIDNPCKKRNPVGVGFKPTRLTNLILAPSMIRLNPLRFDRFGNGTCNDPVQSGPF